MVMTMDARSSLVEKVVKIRAKESLQEIQRHYPNTMVTTEMHGDRGVITVLEDRFVVSKEFVETEESLYSPHCMAEYKRVLQGKARLVVIVPMERAIKTRMSLLEFNNWWLFYYQVHYYDKEGNIKRMDRKTWYTMMGRPYEGPPRAPEIV